VGGVVGAYFLANFISGLPRNGESILKSHKDFSIVTPEEVQNIPDAEVFKQFTAFQTGFSDLDFSLKADTALASERIVKKTQLNPEKTNLSNRYELNGVTVTTDYERKEKPVEDKSVSLSGETEKIKQTIKLKNHTEKEQTVTVTSRAKISSDTIRYEGREYQLTENAQTFRAYDKTASIPEFAKDLGEADLPDLDKFKNYEHTYKTGSVISFLTEDKRKLSMTGRMPPILITKFGHTKTKRGFFWSWCLRISRFRPIPKR